MTEKEKIAAKVARIADKTAELSEKIWEYAELSYTETKSAAALTAALREEGFTVEENLAGIPTAFRGTAVVGNGKPVIGLLGEFDALDGLSQRAASCVKEAVPGQTTGHGCGHNLLGAGSFAAAVALRDYLRDEKMDGTVIYFGCPAEEGAGSKQFLARAGVFDCLDFAYTWHPATRNEISSKGNVAIIGANFIFDGIASHAGGAPHLGRSALDACELMNIGSNYLREHMINEARVHYAYSDAGGTAPNVVQSHAVIKYEVRAPKVSQMKELFERVVNIARGAALMTGTEMHYDVTMAFSDYYANRTLAPIMQQALEDFGAPAWTAEDYAFARPYFSTYSESTQNSIREAMAEFCETPAEVEAALENPLDAKVWPFDAKDRAYVSGSTDVGDVGYAVPTVELRVATAALGTVGHSWQNTSFAGSSIGRKGMLRAAEVLTLACVRTIKSPERIAAAKEELKAKNGGHYICPLPDDVMPPIGTY